MEGTFLYTVQSVSRYIFWICFFEPLDIISEMHLLYFNEFLCFAQVSWRFCKHVENYCQVFTITYCKYLKEKPHKSLAYSLQHCPCILSSTANATYLLISSFRYVHNWKTFVCDYHLNDQKTFLHHQIQVCSAHARILALGYKSAFSVLPVHGLVIFQHRGQIQNL